MGRPLVQKLQLWEQHFDKRFLFGTSLTTRMSQRYAYFTLVDFFFCLLHLKLKFVYVFLPCTKYIRWSNKFFDSVFLYDILNLIWFIWSRSRPVCCSDVHPNSWLQFVGAALGTSDIKIPAESSTTKEPPSLPAKACCVVVEFLRGGTLKELLYRNRKKKLPFKTVVQLALDLARG